MGFFTKALKKQIKNSFAPSSKKRGTNSINVSKEIREIRKKQEIAEAMRAEANRQSQQYLKIVYDCVELVNSTVNPEVFFNRYNLMLEYLEKLAGLECTGIFNNSRELPSDAFLRVEAQFEDATNAFLDRSFESAKKHAETLKTDAGKKNAIKRYFDNMEKYIHYMSGESLEYFDKMKETNIPTKGE